MSFQEKYLKYKSKYIQLKNQIGSNNINNPNITYFKNDAVKKEYKGENKFV